jgi:hypothetical protein
MKTLLIASFCVLILNAAAGWLLSSAIDAATPQVYPESSFVVIDPPADLAERVNRLGFVAGEKASLAELAVEMQTVHAPRSYSPAEAHALLRKYLPDLSFDFEELGWGPG